MRIKRKIESIGTPLKDWNIQINYGIKTGLNEAFIITGEKRKELLEQDSKSDEIIRPILRGRDIKRYGYDFEDLWLLFIPWHFPLQNDQSIQGASEKAEVAFREQYPAIYNHLLQFKKDLENRNKAETGIRYEWYALQRWGANYWEDFFKQKIIWKIIGNQMAFSIDSNKYIVNNACYILTGPGLEYLLSVLNSNIIKWYSFITNMNKTGVGDVQVGGQNLNLFPVPLISENEQKPFVELVGKILMEKKKNKNTSALEKKIEDLVNQLYGLTEEESKFIESQ